MRFTANQVAFLSNLTKDDILEGLANSGYSDCDDFWDEEFVGISDSGKNFVYRVKFDSEEREGDEGFLYARISDGQIEVEF